VKKPKTERRRGESEEKEYVSSLVFFETIQYQTLNITDRVFLFFLKVWFNFNKNNNIK